MGAAAAPIVAAAAPAVVGGIQSAFGGGKDSSSSSSVSPYAALAATIGKRIEKEVDPLRAAFLRMLLQVVTQGGSAMGTPLSNQATAASMEAGSQAQQQTASDLARTTGGGANPVVAAILASQRQQAGMTTSAIPTEIGQMLLSMVPGAVSSAQSGVGQMIGEAIGGNVKTTGTSTSGTGQINPPMIFPTGTGAPPSTGGGGPVFP